MRLYRIKTVAEELKKHEITIRRWIAEGKVEAVKIDHKHIRITENELQRLKMEKI